jgi:hypothetical protein
MKGAYSIWLNILPNSDIHRQFKFNIHLKGVYFTLGVFGGGRFMPSYEIRGKEKESGRKRTRVYVAGNEEAAQRLAEADGTSIEKIMELPPEPPSERQLEYASDLGISIPTGATKNDLCDLISMKLAKDKPATERHRSFARRYGLEVSNYIGKRALFDQIQAALIATGKERDLVSWFTYRVYRELVKGVDNAPVEGPDDPIIQEVTSHLESDEAIIKSVRRYTGRELIWFGEWTSPDGFVQTGGSNRTYAYKKASSLLRKKTGIAILGASNAGAKQSTVKGDIAGSARAINEPKGCLSVIALTLLAPVGLILSIVWLGELKL